MEPGFSLPLPAGLAAEFTMDGRCALDYNLIDDACAETQAAINANFRQEVFARYRKMARRRIANYYGQTDKWLYRALRKFPIRGSEVCIFGSANPWYEAVALEFKASACCVIEYSDRVSFDDRISYAKPGGIIGKTFPFAFSISSFEHDGLGRYGDPINPNGDFEAMMKARELVTESGLLFFSLPVGKDRICFNAHRIYGRARLPRMLEGWELVASFGFSEDDYDSEVNTARSTPYQPLFVLRRVGRITGV
jgi:hypothetical protein